MELLKEASRNTVELPASATAIYEQGEVAKFLATLSGDGMPNVTLIVSQTPVDPGIVAFGEFMMVKTKKNLGECPRLASIALTPKLEMAGFRGDLEYWTESGPYVERINSIEFFRYNAYGGIHNVAVTAVRELLELPQKISFLKVGTDFAAVRTAGRAGAGGKTGGIGTPLPVRTKFNSIMSIKVIAFERSDGYPGVAPLFGVVFRSPGELRFKVSDYNRSSLDGLDPGARVALNVLTMELMTYQLKGVLIRFQRTLGVEYGVVRVDEAYSCMPPLVAERIA